MSDLAELRSDTDSKFTFQGQKLLLTYATHITKTELIEFIEETIRFKLKFGRAAHEIGTSEGVDYPHTHVLLDFGKSWKCRNPRKFDVETDPGVIIHPNWKPVKNQLHWTNAVAYLAKEDPENADLKTSSTVRRIWESKSKAEALLENIRGDPSAATGILTIFAAKPRAQPTCAEPDRPWQKDVIRFLEEKPDHRSIHWFYDSKGNVGKSHLARYLMINKRAHVCKQTGNARDFATQITNALDEGWDQRCMIFDFARSADLSHVYQAIESIKDGIITSVKYSGTTLCFEQPHVLVFSNNLPDENCLSRDRWRIHTIQPDWTLKGNPFASLLAEQKNTSLSPPATNLLTGLIESRLSGDRLIPLPLPGALNIISAPGHADNIQTDVVSVHENETDDIYDIVEPKDEDYL